MRYGCKLLCAPHHPVSLIHDSGPVVKTKSLNTPNSVVRLVSICLYVGHPVLPHHLQLRLCLCAGISELARVCVFAPHATPRA